jgi:hypothetical protein
MQIGHKGLGGSHRQERRDDTTTYRSTSSAPVLPYKESNDLSVWMGVAFVLLFLFFLWQEWGKGDKKRGA